MPFKPITELINKLRIEHRLIHLLINKRITDAKNQTSVVKFSFFILNSSIAVVD